MVNMTRSERFSPISLLAIVSSFPVGHVVAGRLLEEDSADSEISRQFM